MRFTDSDSDWILKLEIGVGILLYLAMASSVTFSLWGILLKHTPVSRIAVFGLTNPVFGVLLSALILREASQSVPLQICTALFLVCLGTCLVNRPEKKKEERIKKGS